jgi:hypothetical protein
MQHFDEHTLEMYVLGTRAVAGRREEIERHLAVCHGCRTMVESMREFYRAADKAVDDISLEEGKAEKSLARAKRSLTPLYADAGPVGPPHRPVTTMQKFQYFVRRHPVVAGSGVLACMIVALLAFLLPPRKPPEAVEIDHAYPNVKTGRLEVYGAQGNLLWAIPSYAISSADKEDSFRFSNFVSQVSVADLDGDGRKEVLTTLPLWDESVSESLRVFGGMRKLVWSRGFDRQTTYKAKTYTSHQFHPGSMLVLPGTKPEHREIFVTCALSYSPTFIARLDADGVEIGSYWHFGQLQIRELEDQERYSGQLLAYGIDDTPDDSQNELPFLALLDPSRIVGRAQSTATPGFAHLPFSRAERYYISFPLTDMHRALQTNASVTSVAQESDSVIAIDIRGAFRDGGFIVPDFTYYLNRRMAIVQVKSKNPTDRLHARLRKEGRITSVMGPDYLEQLRRGARYWDGSGWRDTPTIVANPEGSIAKQP